MTKGKATVYGRDIGNEWLSVVNDSSRMVLQIVNSGATESIIEIKSYKEYTLADRSLILDEDVLGILNCNEVTTSNTFIGDHSWTRPLDKIHVCECIVVTGPPNSGKSTYIGYLLN